MRREYRRRFRRTCRFPVQIELSAIPIGAKVEECLSTHDFPFFETFRLEPIDEFALRLEGGDVGSSEPNIIPETTCRNEKMDQRLAEDATVLNFEFDRFAACWRMRLKHSVAEERENR